MRLASQQKSKKRNNEDNKFRRSTTSIPRTSRPCFKTRAVKWQSVKYDSRTAPSALSAGQLFWQRRFKFVQRAFSLREIALEPQSFTKFSGGFHWFTKPRQHIAQFQMNLGIAVPQRKQRKAFLMDNSYGQVSNKMNIIRIHSVEIKKEPDFSGSFLLNKKVSRMTINNRNACAVIRRHNFSVG